MIYLYIFSSVILVSLISFVGVFTLSFNEKKLRNITSYLVSLSAGSLLGGSLLHLMPEVIDAEGNNLAIWLFLIIGLLSFFILEKVINWRHCHFPTTHDHPHPIGVMNLVGDGFHNFIDGVIIASAYLVDINLGIATTLAVITHEVPQEIGDFGVLIYAGYSKLKALFFNFLSALISLFGALLVLFFNFSLENIALYVLPFAAGGFIYIATSDLLPELKKENRTRQSILQVLVVVVGVLVMFLIR